MNDKVVDYKDTLNLPKTNFPMKANLAQREPKMLEFWKKINIYNRIQEKNSSNTKTFILNDGPPYANGDIHVGHALNKIVKDFVVKSKSFSGYKAPFVPGWDCHGLPIELKVEKKVGKPGVKIDAKEFRQKCREFAIQQVEIQKKSFERLGVFADWENPYLTMDFAFEANTIRALAKIVENGHLVKGDRPVHWCLDCCSSLAEAEVEYQNKTSPSIDVLFDVVEKEKILLAFNLQSLNNKKISVVIWTTTPWTLPANQAVALHKDLKYSLLSVKHKEETKQIIIANELIESVFKRCEITDYEVIATTTGERLEGVKLQHPFYERQVPVILGEHVTTDAGTGCVHTAPAHGHDDYVCGLKYNLPIDNPVGSNGSFLENVPLFANLFVMKANPKVIEVLNEKGALLHHESLNHSYPHCWRHKTPLIFRATSQWFVGLDKQGLREKALEEIKKVKWVPSWGEARIYKMIQGRPDWCISRQRTWGVPMSLVVHKETGELHPECVSIMKKVADEVQQKGIDAWYEMDLNELIGNDAENYEKLNDTLDVWFDSGVVHHTVLDLNEKLQFPADLYLEGSDQHRGWFHSSMLTSVAMKGVAPYKQVLTHGFILDTSGAKMSKSMGNVLSPQKIMQTMGADILRLWVAASDYSADIHISEEIFKRFSDSYRRIRNTSKFLLSNLDGFSKNEIVPFDKMISLDKWIVKYTMDLQKEIIELYDNYKFHSVYQAIHNFCVVQLGSFYLDVIKDRQYTCKANSIARKSAQTAIFYVTEALVRWVAPILSFTAEEIWENMEERDEESVFLTKWFDNFPNAELDDMNNEYWQEILKVRSCVNKALEDARASGTIGSSLEANVTLYCDDDLLNKFKKLKNELKFILITSSAKVDTIKNKGNAIATEIENLFVKVEKSTDEKCVRCWHRVPDVNSNKEYPGVCQRCVQNIADNGEVREYA